MNRSEPGSSEEPNQREAGSDYPEPLIIQPSRKHRQSFIVLHGRGDNARAFGPLLLTMSIEPSDASQPDEYRTLATAFPNAKFIFPTAALRRAQVFKRMLVHQWFDIWSIKEQETKEYLQIEGLQESTRYVHGILRREIQEVGAENVVIGGLSQGCAAMLVALLLWEGEAPGAAFGMCGWLPFAGRMLDAMAMSDNDIMDAGDPFKREDAELKAEKHAQNPPSSWAAGLAWLREMLDMPVELNARESRVAQTPVAQTPVYLGHGVEDKKVPIKLGRTAQECLSQLGANVTEVQEHQTLAHWYSPKMLREIEAFLKDKTGWREEA